MVNKDECMVIRKQKERGYSIVMLHGITIRTSSEGLLTTKESLKELITNPCITDNKDSVSIFRIGLIDDTSMDTTIPITKITRLLIDYDNDKGDKNIIDKFINKFKKYSFILFTTFSSTVLVPRFKVILKLEHLLDYRMCQNKNFINNLENIFTIDGNKPDATCFIPSHFQHLPCKKKNGYYKYVFNKGKKFDLGKDIFPDYFKINMMDMMIKYNLKINTIKKENKREKKILNKLKIIQSGIREKTINETLNKYKKKTKKDIISKILCTNYAHRHEYLMDIAPWFNNNVFTLEEVEKLCPKATGKPMTEKHLKKFKACVKSLKKHDKLNEDILK